MDYPAPTIWDNLFSGVPLTEPYYPIPDISPTGWKPVAIITKPAKAV
ncbi:MULTISPECIES: hypothetical protein [Calothrix]|uniref:Uncharacterized protein n=2 Tax=Calothrix TaxID=1186 RepID=A0ABR8AKA6_9CYAN|nr:MULTISPECIES: hypothetical protein [Calothrix]MBD2200214.1 hypothetical protein [Calothrix parietina FACHB-288]MBD2229187.1 hypothetical protein [Calothrix anomala FACHB-343]